MKITISSTSMMKPMLYTQTHSPTTHPKRILGLLERVDAATKTVDVYERPASSGLQALSQPWGNFMQIPDNDGHLCAAVFGFKFDGYQTWYRIWNPTTAKAYWLLHTDAMDYKPYAIITMDALVTLIPSWNGELFINLATTQDGRGSGQQQYQSATSDTNQSYELVIIDAATTGSGQLWFLVSITDNHKTDNVKSDAIFSTGWISNNQQTATAA